MDLLPIDAHVISGYSQIAHVVAHKSEAYGQWFNGDSMDSLLPWKRVRAALFQYVQRSKLSQSRLEQVLVALPRLVELCGSYARNRKTALRLGIALLQSHPRLIATACPDYSHHNGRYTYEGLRDGVPLLLKLHRPFLDHVCRIAPHLQVEFVIADHESEFEPLCRSVGLGQQEFHERVLRSVVAASRSVRSRGWKVSTFTRRIPGFSLQVQEMCDRLSHDPALLSRFAAETVSRSSYFDRVGYPPEVWFDRTVQIAAQYLVFGRYCAQQNIVVCNHTTISLGWLIKAGVAFLENPVKIY